MKHSESREGIMSTINSLQRFTSDSKTKKICKSLVELYNVNSLMILKDFQVYHLSHI